MASSLRSNALCLGRNEGSLLWPDDMAWPNGSLNQHIFKVSAKPAVQEGWLYWALRYVTDRIERSAHGFKDTLVHVKKSDIDRQPVLVPPIEQQESISKYLIRGMPQSPSPSACWPIASINDRRWLNGC